MIKAIELFGGIGAATQALKRQFGKENVEIVDYVELDKHAVKSYNAINGTNFIPTDINDIDMGAYEEVDILIAGWPCQDISKAGKLAGIINSKRSSLILTTIQKIGEMINKPKHILLENVAHLFSDSLKEEWNIIKGMLVNLGYKISTAKLNSKKFGIPQNRDRAFILMTRNDIKYKDINHLENREENYKPLKNFLDMSLQSDIPKEYYEKKVLSKNGNFYSIGGKKGVLTNHSFNRYWNSERFVGTLHTYGVNKIFYGNVFRNLTTKESWNIMGFETDAHDKCKAIGISNSKLYVQAGNSIVVNVLEAIFEELFKGEKNV